MADELDISRVAERLHVAQPAVSEQIRKLERISASSYSIARGGGSR